jgi:hypothetical protein
VGHQILTGKQPFEGSSHSILYKHVFEPPPRILEIRPEVPPDLCEALERALSKEPEQRFATMEDFAAAMSGDRTGPRTVVSAPIKPASKSTSAGKPRRRVVQWSLITIALCVALGGGAWAGLRPLEPSIPARPSVPVPQPVLDSTTTTPPAVVSPVVQSNPSEPARPRIAKKEYALLTVASEPWGTLFVGNKEIGPTPIADYPLPVGTHRLRIEQEGYRTKTETIVVTGPNPIRRRYLLEPAGPP